jgi:Na+/H+ antiporter NhaC
MAGTPRRFDAARAHPHRTRRHALYVAIPVAVLALVVWWRRRESLQVQAADTASTGSTAVATHRRSFLAPASTAATVVIAVLSIAAAGAACYDIFRIGDSGAQATWQGQFSSTPAPRGPER